MIQAKRPVRVAVVYYSATGNVHALARAVSEGAAREGAEVRLRHVAELNQEMLISFNSTGAGIAQSSRINPKRALEDIDWADGIAFGTPTRFGNVAAQLKLFLDLTGELWQQGRLDRQGRDGVHVLADRARRPGVDDPRPQQHAVPLGRDRAPARVHGARSLQRRRKPLRRIVHKRPPRRWAGVSRRSWSRGRRELDSLVSRG